MNVKTMFSIRNALAALVGLVAWLIVGTAMAGDITPKMQKKIDERVAFTSMPAIYIGKGKPNFDEAFDGRLWHQGESKPDPSTNIDTVQIAAPVKDGGQVIGVLLVSLTASGLQ